MQNPILSRLNSSPLNGRLQQIANLKQMINGKNPNAVMNAMMQNNPKFREFVNANKGKSAEQIARENGIDLDLLKQVFR